MFSLADGIGNNLYPTSSVLTAVLAISGIPYGKWLKRVWPLALGQVVISLVALIIAHLVHYGPF